MAATYVYSSAELSAIVAGPSVPLTPPGGGGTTSTISMKYPGQSITLVVIPTK